MGVMRDFNLSQEVLSESAIRESTFSRWRIGFPIAEMDRYVAVVVQKRCMNLSFRISHLRWNRHTVGKGNLL